VAENSETKPSSTPKSNSNQNHPIQRLQDNNLHEKAIAKRTKIIIERNINNIRSLKVVLIALLDSID
jgi:hypothetical protein